MKPIKEMKHLLNFMNNIKFLLLKKIKLLKHSLINLMKIIITINKTFLFGKLKSKNTKNKKKLYAKKSLKSPKILPKKENYLLKKTNLLKNSINKLKNKKKICLKIMKKSENQIINLKFNSEKLKPLMPKIQLLKTKLKNSVKKIKIF
jgi:hypothetical protein